MTLELPLPLELPDEAAGTVTSFVELLCMRAETPAPAPAPARTAAATTAANHLPGRAGAAGYDAGFGGDPPSSWPGSPGWGMELPGSESRTRSSAVLSSAAVSSVVTNVMRRYSGPDL